MAGIQAVANNVLCDAQNRMAGITATRFDWSVVVKGGGIEDYVINGTYIHPRLLPALAMWINPSFYFLAAEITENFAMLQAYDV
jgi:KilA-N domain